MLRRLLLLAGLLAPATGHAAILGNPIPSIQSTAAEGSHILKASAGYLNGFSSTSPSAGYVLFFDSTTVPADGTVTPKLCYALAASQTAGGSWLTYPVPFNTGIVVVFSSTGCFQKTVSNVAFFSAQVQ